MDKDDLIILNTILIKSSNLDWDLRTCFDVALVDVETIYRWIRAKNKSREDSLVGPDVNGDR